MAKLIQDLSIGGNLRKLREARGLTQEDVCARMAQLGRPMLQSAYSQIETGRRNLFVSDPETNCQGLFNQIHKKATKKCQKQILAPDTFADGLFAPA